MADVFWGLFQSSMRSRLFHLLHKSNYSPKHCAMRSCLLAFTTDINRLNSFPMELHFPNSNDGVRDFQPMVLTLVRLFIFSYHWRYIKTYVYCIHAVTIMVWYAVLHIIVSSSFSLHVQLLPSQLLINDIYA